LSKTSFFFSAPLPPTQENKKEKRKKSKKEKRKNITLMFSKKAISIAV